MTAPGCGGADEIREQMAAEIAQHSSRMDDRTGDRPPIVWHIVCDCGWDGGPVEVGRGLSAEDHLRVQLHVADALLSGPLAPLLAPDGTP